MLVLIMICFIGIIQAQDISTITHSFNKDIALSKTLYSQYFAVDSNLVVFIEADTTRSSLTQKYILGTNYVYTVKALDKQGDISVIGLANSYKLSGYMSPTGVKLTDQYIIVMDTDTGRMNFYSRMKPYKFSHFIACKDSKYSSIFDIYKNYLFFSRCPDYNESSNSLCIYKIKHSLFGKTSLSLNKTLVNSKEYYEECKKSIDHASDVDHKLIKDADSSFVQMLYDLVSKGAYQNTHTIVNDEIKLAINSFGEKLYILDDHFNITDSLDINPIKDIHKLELQRDEIKFKSSKVTFTSCNKITYNNNLVVLSYTLSASSMNEEKKKYLNLYYNLDTKKLVSQVQTNALLIGNSNNSNYFLDKFNDSFVIYEEKTLNK